MGQTVCREEVDFDNSADLTDAFTAGQSWMYHKMQVEINGYKEALADKAHYTRKLDVIWNGEEGAAKQAALMDVVGQIEDELPVLRQEIKDYRKALEHIKANYWRAGGTFDLRKYCGDVLDQYKPHS
jgi:hypothetical protein